MWPTAPVVLQAFGATGNEGGDFQLEVHLRLINGIKDLCCGAQNRTEKRGRERERWKKEREDEMERDWKRQRNDTDATGWLLLEQPKRALLTQICEYGSHILCVCIYTNIYNIIFFFFTNASLGLQPWKTSSVPCLEWLDPYVSNVEKKAGGWFSVFVYLWSFQQGDRRNKPIWKYVSTCVYGREVKKSEWRRESRI